MTKISFSELLEKFYQHNTDNNVVSQFDDPNPLYGVVVFSSDNWPDKDFSLESRSYRFRSDNKYFISGMGGNSIFSRNLSKDDDIRLDWYLGSWKIDYCYIDNED